MEIEVSNGEIVDKYTILLIKDFFITDEDKLANVKKELAYISPIVEKLNVKQEQINRLRFINNALWQVENEIRECESAERFDDYFIALARQVYMINDKRAELKKQINIDTNSNFTEEKSY